MKSSSVFYCIIAALFIFGGGYFFGSKGNMNVVAFNEKAEATTKAVTAANADSLLHVRFITQHVTDSTNNVALTAQVSRLDSAFAVMQAQFQMALPLVPRDSVDDIQVAGQKAAAEWQKSAKPATAASPAANHGTTH